MAITEELLHDVFAALGKMPSLPEGPAYDDPYAIEWRQWVNGIRELIHEAVKPASLLVQFYEEDGTVDITFSDGRNIVMTCDEAWRVVVHLESELKKQRKKADDGGQV